MARKSYRTTTTQIDDDLYNKFERKSRESGMSPDKCLKKILRLFVGDER